MPFHLPRLQARAGVPATLLRVLVCILLAAASIHLTSQHARTRLGLSGDEYYFYYAAAGQFKGVPSDPIWSMQAELRSAQDRLENATRNDPVCDRLTEQPRTDLKQLSFLLEMESGSQGYGPGSLFQGMVLRAWNSLVPPPPDKGAGFAPALGTRIAAAIGLPMALVMTVCFLALAISRSVAIACALGLYVLLHGMIPPAAEAYWTLATQDLESASWIIKTAVGLPFLNPRYSDSLVAIAPRGYLVLPFLLALACRWAGATRWSYAVAATLPLFHPPIGTMIFGMLAMVDVVARPRVFADRVVAALTFAVFTMAALGPAGSIFLALAGNGWIMAGALAAIGCAVAYAWLLPQRAWFRTWSDRLSANVLLLDVFVFGPLFLLAWSVVAVLHARFGIITGYGIANLATKSGAVAHHVFFFGVSCLLFAAAVRALSRRFGEERAATAALLAAGGVALIALTAAPPHVPPGTGTVMGRFAAIAQAHDRTVQQRPLKLGDFETHLMWHRIVRQRETGEEWVRGAIDLSPYRAACRLP